jgi:hypothetical protein
MPLAGASLCAAERPAATRLRSAPEPMRRYVATLDLDNLADHAKLVTVYSDVMQAPASGPGTAATTATSSP